MFLSGKFYFAIADAMLVTVLNISQEAMQSRWNASVYYLVVSSHGVGAFFEVFSVLAVLPFALSYWEDSRNGYLRCIETRIGRTAYCWSHLVVAFFGSVISIFLGMAVVYGVLALKIPWIKKEELETLTGSLSYGNGLVLPFYLAARFGVEAVKYAFMAVFCAYDIGKNKKSVCAGQHTGSFLLCKPACSRSAAAAGPDEMVPAPWGKYPEFLRIFL